MICYFNYHVIRLCDWIKMFSNVCVRENDGCFCSCYDAYKTTDDYFRLQK